MGNWPAITQANLIKADRGANLLRSAGRRGAAGRQSADAKLLADISAKLKGPDGTRPQLARSSSKKGNAPGVIPDSSRRLHRIA
jgi:hypothetical protein